MTPSAHSCSYVLPAPASAVANDSATLMTSVRCFLGNEVHRTKGVLKEKRTAAFWNQGVYKLQHKVCLRRHCIWVWCRLT